MLPQILPPSQAQTTIPPAAATVSSTSTNSLEMKLQRLPDSVELVIEGVGQSPQLQQSASGYIWQGLLLTSQPASLRLGPQKLSLPDAGFDSFTLEGSGSNFRLAITPMPGAAVPKPVVSANGRDLILSFAAPRQARSQTLTPSLNRPGSIPRSVFVPPLQQRAEAPPVGDIAVGTMMLANPSYLNISGSPVTMSVRNAPAKDVLMSLAQQAGYGFVYVQNNDDELNRSCGLSKEDALTRPVSLSFRNENYAKAFNSALVSSCLQAKREGNTIMVGPDVLSRSFGATMSKVFRLNQVSASDAADYLANLGAMITRVNNVTTAITEGSSQSDAIAGAPNRATTASSTSTKVESYRAAQGPLNGLIGTTDSRLDTITLVGDPRVIAIAETYLRQLDLRQRQVALSVRILDVSLDNTSSLENSFAFRYGNNFIVNDRGELQAAFNNQLPPIGPLQGVTAATPNPGGNFTRGNFFDLLRASIVSGGTKVLASPTLILTDNPQKIRDGSDRSLLSQSLGSSSGGGGGATSSSSGGGSGSGTTDGSIGRSRANEAFVTVGEQVVTGYTVTSQINTPNVCTPNLGVAGLTFGARVSKIDDNGFVTFSISPTITASIRQQNINQCGPIDILAIRSLDSGGARVRDGQTLIMTGVISERDLQTVRKWPILGDLPLVGQFFRQTSGSRSKRELVILVTPRILRDDAIGAFSSGYQPATSPSRDLLGMNPSP